MVSEPALGLDPRDEAGVGQKGTQAYVWARLAQGSVRRSWMEWQDEGPIGSRPAMVRDNRHDSAHRHSAICPARGVGAAIIMSAAHAEGMSEHLEEISTRVGPGAHSLLLCEGAGRHQVGEKLRVPDNVTLLPLPAYAPELNPMENVWEHLRANKLCALVWDSYEAIVEACSTAWGFLISDPARIRSSGTRARARVNV